MVKKRTAYLIPCSICGAPSVAKGQCAKHYSQNKGINNWYNKEYNFARNNLTRYLSHRYFIYTKFKNSKKGMNRFYQLAAWEQRLQEMDVMFIEQIQKDFIDAKIDLNVFVEYCMRKFEEMDKQIKENDGHITMKICKYSNNIGSSVEQIKSRRNIDEGVN